MDTNIKQRTKHKGVDGDDSTPRKRKRDQPGDRQHSSKPKRKHRTDGDSQDITMEDQDSSTTKERRSKDSSKKHDRRARIREMSAHLESLPGYRRRSASASVQPDDTSTFHLPASSSSPFHLQTSSLYLPLAPIAQSHAVEGLCAEHISPLILTYYPPFDGILLSYSNPRISDEPFGETHEEVYLQCIDEYPVAWTWFTADFLIFRPGKGQWMEGVVNLQNEGHMGLLCWNLFNASIERERLPSDWTWMGSEHEHGDGNDNDAIDAASTTDHFVDGDGVRVQGLVKFRIRDMESSHGRGGGFLHIEGTMLDDRAEARLARKEEASKRVGRRRSNVVRDYGATSLGQRRDANAEDSLSRDRWSRS